MNRERIEEPLTEEIKRNGRRQFLSKIWKILGFIALAELIYFIISMLRPGKKVTDGNGSSTLKVAGNVEDFPPDSVTPDRVSKFFLVRTVDGGFLALSITCSHLGCSVLWNDEKSQFICPCHSSAFDKEGIVLNSPAPRPLDYYPVIIESGKVKVDLSQKIKRKNFDKSQVTYAI